MILFNLPAITTALTASKSAVYSCPRAPISLLVRGDFLYGSGGTTFNAWLQTSLDGGATFYDIANWSATTALLLQGFNLSALTAVTTAKIAWGIDSITANTSLDGFLGTQYQVVVTTTGTYAGATSFRLDAVFRYAA